MSSGLAAGRIRSYGDIMKTSLPSGTQCQAKPSKITIRFTKLNRWARTVGYTPNLHAASALPGHFQSNNL